MATRKKIPGEPSSGNVFADLGLANADELLAKAKLASTISDVIEERHLTQVEAGRIMGIAQPEVSLLIRGRLDDFSVDRLLKMLMRLERDVEIVIRRTPKKRAGVLNIVVDDAA